MRKIRIIESRFHKIKSTAMKQCKHVAFTMLKTFYAKRWAHWQWEDIAHLNARSNSLKTTCLQLVHIHFGWKPKDDFSSLSHSCRATAHNELPKLTYTEYMERSSVKYTRENCNLFSPTATLPVSSRNEIYETLNAQNQNWQRFFFWIEIVREKVWTTSTPSPSTH